MYSVSNSAAYHIRNHLHQLVEGKHEFCGQQTDRSRALIRDCLWTVAAPGLPTTRQEVTQWLFGQAALRIPVSSMCYKNECQQEPELAPRYLVVAEHAGVVDTFSAVLRRQPAVPASSETDTTAMIVGSIRMLWPELEASPQPLSHTLSFNRSENNSSHSSRAPIKKVRPDTMVIVKKCTLLLGEDKHEDLQAAFDDLERKRATLMRVHYRDVRFLIGYAAAGTSFQWCFMHAEAHKVHSLSGNHHIAAAAAFCRLLHTESG